MSETHSPFKSSSCVKRRERPPHVVHEPLGPLAVSAHQPPPVRSHHPARGKYDQRDPPGVLVGCADLSDLTQARRVDDREGHVAGPPAGVLRRSVLLLRTDVRLVKEVDFRVREDERSPRCAPFATLPDLVKYLVVEHVLACPTRPQEVEEQTVVVVDRGEFADRLPRRRWGETGLHHSQQRHGPSTVRRDEDVSAVHTRVRAGVLDCKPEYEALKLESDRHPPETVEGMARQSVRPQGVPEQRPGGDA
mmetsp:Transcript_30796/g.70398  ORF Transcript_30796/g.70398 Transcript_30796/m.70398 type:complete len:249 (+) Transcript_30796:58-804(+)